MRAYLDASVFLRVVLGAPERLSEWPELEEPFSSELLWTECRRSLHRLRAQGRFTDDQLVRSLEAAHTLLDRVDLAALNSNVLSRAGDPFPVALGTLDALHLSTALLWEHDQGRPLDAFLTHDVELGRAARSVGMRVLGC